jgi:hypothetical protein
MMLLADKLKKVVHSNHDRLPVFGQAGRLSTLYMTVRLSAACRSLDALGTHVTRKPLLPAQVRLALLA